MQGRTIANGRDESRWSPVSSVGAERMRAHPLQKGPGSPWGRWILGLFETSDAHDPLASQAQQACL